MAILFIDDDAELLEWIDREFSGFNIPDDLEIDPIAGLQRIKSKKYSLIVLDQHMPDVQRSDVLEQIRTKYSSMELPVLMFTADGADETAIDCLKKGANDFVPKPVNSEVLKVRIQNLINVNKAYQFALIQKEKETLLNIVATYNHEINNSLMLAYAYSGEAKLNKEKTVAALDRIKATLKKLKETVKEETGEPSKEKYAGFISVYTKKAG